LLLTHQPHLLGKLIESNTINNIDNIDKTSDTSTIVPLDDPRFASLIKGYEEQMRKYESDIREHISVEQQLKIYIDNMKYKNECEIKECKIELDDTIAHFNKVIK